MRALRFDERTAEEKDNFADDLIALTDFFKQRFDLDLYLIYGTLLGAVRENDFIADDKDIDVAYMSKYHDFDDIVKEMVEIYQVFFDMKLVRDFGNIKTYPKYCGHAHLYYPTRRTEFDIWTSWIDRAGKFNFWFIGKELDASILYPLSSVQLRNRIVNVPHKYKVLLNFIYSNNWKKPRPNEKGLRYNTIQFDSLCNYCKNPIEGIKEI